MKRKRMRCGLIIFAAATCLSAQPVSAPPGQQAGATVQARPTYVLAPGDQITIRAFEVEEINSTFRIDSEGNVNLPLLGKLHAGGSTVEQFEGELLRRLKTLVKEPQVSVSVTEYRSDPVFLEGAFKVPGIYTLQGGRTLREMLTAVGGLQANASRRITVTRHLEMGPIPLPNAIVDQQKKVTTVQISLAKLRDDINPVEDIILQPLDIVSVDKAELVYVSGEVNRVGGFELGERDSLSVTQAISMAGGLGKDAAADKARVLRQVLNSSRRAEIPVDLKKVLAGKEADFPLMASDVLYVPRSSHAGTWSKVGIIAIPAMTSIIYVMATRL